MSLSPVVSAPWRNDRAPSQRPWTVIVRNGSVVTHRYFRTKKEATDARRALVAELKK